MRLGAPGPYLVLDLYYCTTETQQLNIAISFEFDPFNFCHECVEM